MSRPEDRRAFLGAVLADILDAIPPLPILGTLGSIVDAIQIQNERTAYPLQRTSTGISLLETIESPIPFLPTPLELAPSHVIAVLAAERARRRGYAIGQPGPGRQPPTPPRPPPFLPVPPPLLALPPGPASASSRTYTPPTYIPLGQMIQTAKVVTP